MLDSFIPNGVNGSTYMSSHVISTLHTLTTGGAVVFTVKTGIFKKSSAFLMCRLPVLFFCHRCLDAEKMLVCFTKSITLDSGLQI